MYRYAINLADMMHGTTDVRVIKIILADTLVPAQIIECEPGKMVDGNAVLMQCDDERAKGMIAIIRRKMHRNKFRIYERQGNGNTWKRI